MYLITDYKDKYFITNTRADGKDSYYHIYKLKDCSTTKAIGLNNQLKRDYAFFETVFVKNNAKLELNLPDGDYRVRDSLDPLHNTQGFTTSIYKYLNVYTELQKRLLRNMREFLCEPCNSVPESLGGCVPVEFTNYIKYQGILNELLTYNFLARKPYPNENGCDKNCVYNNTLNLLLEIYKCSIIPSIMSQNSSECLTGKVEFNLNLFRQFVSIYYTIFYIEEFSLFGLDEESKDYITIKYDFDKVRVCSNNIGLNFDYIFDIYEEQTQLCNIEPSVDNATITVKGKTVVPSPVSHYFSSYEFTTNYFDPSYHTPVYVKIISLPTKGTLYLTTPGSSPQVVSIDAIVSITNVPNLSYVTTVVENNANWDSFKFQVINSGNRYTNIATIKIKTLLYTDRITIGNKDITLPNRLDYVLRLTDFTNTSPPYYSEDGSQLQRIRIDLIYTTAMSGILYLDGVVVTSGTIIDRQDVLDGLLKYVASDEDLVSGIEFIWSGSNTLTGDNFVN